MAEIQTTIANITDSFMPTIEKQLENHGIIMDGYQRECAINAFSSINQMITNAGLNWHSPELDFSNIQDVVKKVTLQKLNSIATNREVYFQFRKTKIGGVWKKQIEVGIEGDGNDAILRNFGVDVKKVHTFWEVREGDDFEYPHFEGVEMTLPKWQPKGNGKVIRVVYPIEKTDGTVEFRIAERADVVKNLQAHISNNMMNETFGLCADRYNATVEQKKQIEQKKQDIKAKIRDMSLDELLDCPDVQTWISPSWLEAQSRESMIVRKMRNNAIKKYPKNFGNAYTKQIYNELSDEATAETAREIKENIGNGEVVDIVDVESKPAPESPVPKTISVNKETGEVREEKSAEPETSSQSEQDVPQTTATEKAEEDTDDFLKALDGEPSLFIAN